MQVLAITTSINPYIQHCSPNVGILVVAVLQSILHPALQPQCRHTGSRGCSIHTSSTAAPMWGYWYSWYSNPYQHCSPNVGTLVVVVVRSIHPALQPQCGDTGSRGCSIHTATTTPLPLPLPARFLQPLSQLGGSGDSDCKCVAGGGDAGDGGRVWRQERGEEEGLRGGTGRMGRRREGEKWIQYCSLSGDTGSCGCYCQHSYDYQYSNIGAVCSDRNCQHAAGVQLRILLNKI